ERRQARARADGILRDAQAYYNKEVWKAEADLAGFLGRFELWSTYRAPTEKELRLNALGAALAGREKGILFDQRPGRYRIILTHPDQPLAPNPLTFPLDRNPAPRSKLGEGHD